MGSRKSSSRNRNEVAPSTSVNCKPNNLSAKTGGSGNIDRVQGAGRSQGLRWSSHQRVEKYDAKCSGVRKRKAESEGKRKSCKGGSRSWWRMRMVRTALLQWRHHH